MEWKAIVDGIINNIPYIVGLLAMAIVILVIMVINLSKNLKKMQKRYNAFMAGSDGSGNLECVILDHIDKVRDIERKNDEIRRELSYLREYVDTSITKVGVVRFCAFENMGSDQSYSVAMLDANNNGIVLSSIFGREISRNYVKPIKDGRSNYALSDEEERALSVAMDK